LELEHQELVEVQEQVGHQEPLVLQVKDLLGKELGFQQQHILQTI
jgi:hypothetical protein